MKYYSGSILFLALSLSACSGLQSNRLPPVLTDYKLFEDVTADLCAAENGWYKDNPSRSFSIGSQSFPASFVDWNNDGYLDYFFSNHYRDDYTSEWDFSLNVPSETSRAGRCFLSVGDKVFRDTDAETSNHDSHGSTFADLDDDGLLDLLVSVGGNRGSGLGPHFDNLLFWGSESGGAVTLEGGRDTAHAAGLEGRNERGRFMYVTDANRDGLLDVIPITDVRVDNLLSPSVLRINSGARSFAKDPNMQEYTRAILLTDADGDGHAQEYVVFRAACFRDPAMDETHGQLSIDYIEFCEARPQNTIAIYKYLNGAMTLVSPVYHRRLEDNVFAPWNTTSARGVLSGDFDNDQKADIAAMYIDKLVLYLSSERKSGELPLYNEDHGHKGSMEIQLSCKKARAVRAVDLDNNGVQELLVACEKPGEFYVLEHTSPKTWTVNPAWQLGDLANSSLPYPTSADLDKACTDDADDALRWVRKKLCKSYLKTGEVSEKATKGTTLSVIDLNNDGFLDAISSHTAGYQRFLINSPAEPRGRFIRFELKPTATHAYGIGTTLLFEAAGLPIQFREISTYGNGNDATGSIDNRIVFGLGPDGIPLKLTVRWPSTKEQVIDLSGVSSSYINNYLNPIVVTEQ